MKAYFISDAHLGREPSAKKNIQVFVDFITGLQGKASHLFLMGDIFDFWIEYRFYIPKDFLSVYIALQNLGQSGVEIHYIAGNHDFAIGSFFKDFPSLTLHHEPVTVKIKDKFYHLLHGDGMLPSDKVYRLYKRIIYSKTFLKLCRLMPIDWLFRCALWFASRVESGHKPISMEQKKKYQIEAFSRLKENPRWSGLLHGHNHILVSLQEAKQVYISTGNWLRNQDYVTLEDGIFVLNIFDTKIK